MRPGVLFVLTVICIQGSMALDQNLRDYFLSTHNNYRSQLALGQIRNKNGTNLPTASNIYELKYSLIVEKIAQDWANGCNIKHSIINGTTNNLFAAHPYEQFDRIAERGATAWLKELENNGLKSLNFTMDVYKDDVGHWVEMNWHDVKEIGCGIANCSKVQGASPSDHWTYVVCAYNPGGNYINELLYTPGLPCSKCTAYKNSKCNKTTGLCYIEKDRTTTHQPSSSAKIPTTHSTDSNTDKQSISQESTVTIEATRISSTQEPTALTTNTSQESTISTRVTRLPSTRKSVVPTTQSEASTAAA